MTLSAEVERIAPPLAKLLTSKLIETLGGVDAVEAFGKAAVVGAAGEIEHGGALIRTPYFGNLMREYLGGESIICFADARAEAGEVLVVPLWLKTQRRDSRSLSDDQHPHLRWPPRRRDWSSSRPAPPALAHIPASGTARPIRRYRQESGERAVMKFPQIVTIVEEIRTDTQISGLNFSSATLAEQWFMSSSPSRK